MSIHVPNTMQKRFNLTFIYQKLLTLFQTGFLIQSNDCTSHENILEVISDEIENFLLYHLVDCERKMLTNLVFLLTIIYFLILYINFLICNISTLSIHIEVP